MKPETKSLTHADLVKLASQWLTRAHSIVITELATQGEEPDAIGFDGARSTLVECKASRSDFLADARKPFRLMPEMGVGVHRYYLAPEGLIRVEELPPGWGLLEARESQKRGHYVHESCASRLFPERNTGHELRILNSLLRRIGASAPKGVSIKCYSIQTQNRATLTVSDDVTQ